LTFVIVVGLGYFTIGFFRKERNWYHCTTTKLKDRGILPNKDQAEPPSYHYQISKSSTFALIVITEKERQDIEYKEREVDISRRETLEIGPSVRD
jgi:hypothetical protein